MENVNEVRTSPITEQALAMFTGSESFHRHSLVRNVIFTEGCTFLCRSGAAWLIDAIAIPQNCKALLGEEFQSWKLAVDEASRSAVLTATDGGASEDKEGNPVYKTLYRQKIPYTDFPLSEVSIYCCANGQDRNGKTILLASEY